MEIQIVELHFSELARCDFAAIKARVEDILAEELDAPGSETDDDVYLLAHKEHIVSYSDGAAVPAQTGLISVQRPIDIRSYTGDIQQSWGFRNCETVLRESQHTLVVTEMLSRGLSSKDRIRLFHGVLQAAVEETNACALVFKHSQQVVQPTTYLQAIDKDPVLRPGALNVRFFNIENTDGEMLMDTRGLNEIGLHDLQCHFRGLDPNDVATLLYNTAVYIFEGAAIESGHTIAGVGSNSKMVCQYENSLVEPKRQLLDLNPGYPYAAGEREQG